MNWLPGSVLTDGRVQRTNNRKAHSAPYERPSLPGRFAAAWAEAMTMAETVEYGPLDEIEVPAFDAKLQHVTLRNAKSLPRVLAYSD